MINKIMDNYLSEEKPNKTIDNYLGEENLTIYRTLLNMVSIVSNKKDLNYIIEIVDKALLKSIITKKEHFKLRKEIHYLSKHI